MKINGIIVLIVCLELITISFCASISNSSVTSLSSKPKTKRGILQFGNGLTYSPPHISELAFGLPHKPLITTQFAKLPGIYRNVISPPTIPNFAFTHGGAAVTSYNINYPRYPILSQKPYFFSPQPALPKPILPTPSFIIPQKPIIPIAISPFGNQFPAVLPKPFPTPSYAFIPSYPGHTILPSNHIHPRFVPIHLPHLPPTVSTFPGTTTLPLPGTTIIANAQPTPASSDSWRPVIVTQTPFQRPAISLLPPVFSQNDRRSAQLEFQSTYDQEYTQPQQLYQRSSPTFSNIGAIHQHHLNEQGIFDGKLLVNENQLYIGRYLLPQSKNRQRNHFLSNKK